MWSGLRRVAGAGFKAGRRLWQARDNAARRFDRESRAFLGKSAYSAADWAGADQQSSKRGVSRDWSSLLGKEFQFQGPGEWVPVPAFNEVRRRAGRIGDCLRNRLRGHSRHRPSGLNLYRQRWRRICYWDWRIPRWILLRRTPSLLWPAPLLWAEVPALPPVLLLPLLWPGLPLPVAGAYQPAAASGPEANPGLFGCNAAGCAATGASDQDRTGPVYAGIHGLLRPEVQVVQSLYRHLSCLQWQAPLLPLIPKRLLFGWWENI